jgi:cytochrome c oxidase subunit II
VIPGRYSTVWFTPTTPGTYHLFCTQYCGTLHSQMIGWVTVMTPDDYKAWSQGSTSGMSLAQNGERLYASLGCNACHSGEASARGPNLAASYMTRVQLTNGSYATVDDAFLRDSILNPTMHQTAGYAPIMPTYQGQISEEGLIDLVEYIKQLNSNYRIQQTLNTTQVQSQVSSPAQHTAPVAPGMVKP